MFFDVQLPERIAEIAVDHADAAFPARARQLLARQHRAEKIEAGIVERLAEIRRGRGDVPGDEPRLPRAEGHARHHRGEGLEEGRLREDHGGRSVDALRLRPRRPVEPGHLGRQLAQREPRVGRADVAVLGFGPLNLRELGLQGEHGPGVVRRGSASAEREDAFEILLVPGANRRQCRIVREVIVAIGQQGPALEHADDGWSGVERVDAGGAAERPAGGDRRQVARLGRQIARRLDRVDPAQLGLDRGGAELLEARLVHDAGVEIGDLLGGRSARPVRTRGDLFDDRAQIEVGAVGDLGERAVADAIAGHRDARQPAAVDMAIQIVLGRDGTIEAGDIDPRPR